MRLLCLKGLPQPEQTSQRKSLRISLVCPSGAVASAASQEPMNPGAAHGASRQPV